MFESPLCYAGENDQVDGLRARTKDHGYDEAKGVAAQSGRHADDVGGGGGGGSGVGTGVGVGMLDLGHIGFGKHMGIADDDHLSLKLR